MEEKLVKTMQSHQLMDKRKFEIREKNFLWIFLLLCAYVVFTNCTVPILNTLFAAVLLCVVALCPMEIGLSVTLFLTMFFGFSVIRFPMVISGINMNTIRNVVALLFAFRVVAEKNFKFFKKLNFLLPFILYMFLMEFIGDTLTMAISRATMIIACWKFIKIRTTDARAFRTVEKLLIMMTLFTFIYGLIHIDISYGKDGFRFAGVEDPNNFALNCNICLFFIFSDKELFKNQLYKIAIVTALVIGCLLTVSMSGIFTLLALFVAFFCIFNKKYRAIGILLLIILALLVGVVFPLLISSEGGVFSFMAQRINLIYDSLLKGDMGTATTDRSDLWEQYMGMFDRLSVKDKFFGVPTLIEKWMAASEENLASHNFYIDTLISYGYIGLALYLGLLAYAIYTNVRERKYKQLLICLLLTANIFFRSMNSVLVMSLALCYELPENRKGENNEIQHTDTDVQRREVHRGVS